MPLSQSAIEDLRLAARKMKLVERRDFFADMCLKYCQENHLRPKSLRCLLYRFKLVANSLIISVYLRYIN